MYRTPGTRDKTGAGGRRFVFSFLLILVYVSRSSCLHQFVFTFLVYASLGQLYHWDGLFRVIPFLFTSFFFYFMVSRWEGSKHPSKQAGRKPDLIPFSYF